MSIPPDPESRARRARKNPADIASESDTQLKALERAIKRAIIGQFILSVGDEAKTVKLTVNLVKGGGGYDLGLFGHSDDDLTSIKTVVRMLESLNNVKAGTFRSASPELPIYHADNIGDIINALNSAVIHNENFQLDAAKYQGISPGKAG